MKQILLRVSEDEKKQIEKMAKDNKMSVTAFIKNRVLSNDISESYINDSFKMESFYLKQIEELKKEREEDRKHYREWIEGMNRTLQLLNDEKENLLERNNVLSIELEEQKNKTFLKRLKGLFKWDKKCNTTVIFYSRFVCLREIENSPIDVRSHDKNYVQMLEILIPYI